MAGPGWTSYDNGCSLRPKARASPLHELWPRAGLYDEAQAEAVRERLEADARTIEDLQRQIAELQALTPRFREQATETYRPPEQLRLLAAEEMPAYRQCSPHRG